MAEEASQEREESFDLERLRELVELMEKHGVTEVDLRQGGERWRLRRGSTEPQVISMAPMAAPAAPAPVAAAPAAPPAAAAPAAPEPDNATYITSPTVGTFYSSPSPDDPAFVSVGSDVTAETIVCIVEAMKVFNQIPAEVAGKIAEVLVSDGDAIEFGQALFRVQPA